MNCCTSTVVMPRKRSDFTSLLRCQFGKQTFGFCDHGRGDGGCLLFRDGGVYLSRRMGDGLLDGFFAFVDEVHNFPARSFQRTR